MLGCGPIYTPAWFYCLVRALVFVDIDIFGVDYVVRFLLLLRAGGRTTTCSGACCRSSGLRRARYLVGLVNHLSNLVQLPLEGLRSRAQPRCAAVVGGRPGVLDRFVQPL